MKKILLSALILFPACATRGNNDLAHTESVIPQGEPQTFQQLWSFIGSDPYTVLPVAKVTYGSITASPPSIVDDSKRTIQRTDDVLLPGFNKKVHPIGTCLVGVWAIDRPTQYTGYFKAGTRGLILARVSSALGSSMRGEYRSFGMAAKVFPTMDPNASEMARAANFFAIEDLGGTLANSYLDSMMTNEPKATVRLPEIPVGLVAAESFKKGDINPGIRQLYEVAQLGLGAGQAAVSPTWIQIKGMNTTRTGEADFRNEMKPEKYPERKIYFSIAVTENKADLYTNRPLQIGHIEFTQAVSSYGCDHRLHFHHPKFQ